MSLFTVSTLAPQFGKADYWHTSLIHHRLVRDTLAVAGVVSTCIIDADILLFRSPTDHYDRDEFPYTGTVENREHCERCQCAMNGGFQCFLNTLETRLFADTIVALNETWLSGVMDQAKFPAIADGLGLKHCAFNDSLFTGHLRQSHDSSGLYKDIVSYHANGLGGQGKFDAMRRVLDTKTRVIKEGMSTFTIGEGGM